MRDLRELYQEVILEHSKAPRNYRELATANHRAEGYNPHPVMNAARFHDAPGQDDWRQDGSGVSYLHIVGLQKARVTPVQVGVALNTVCRGRSDSVLDDCSPEPFYYVIGGPGDGTVPILSSSRLGKNFAGSVNGKVLLDVADAEGDNLNAPGAVVLTRLGSVEGDNAVSHGNLPNNTKILDVVLNFFFATGTLPKAAKQEQALTLTAPAPSEFTFTPVFDFRTVGFDPVVVVDENGFSFRAPFGVPTPGMSPLEAFLAGPQAFQILAPANHNYDVRLTSTGRPSKVTISQGLTPDDVSTVTRYLDVNIPRDTVLSFTFGPNDSGTLRRDMDGDGTFETSMAPTVAVSGPATQDVTPPSIKFRAKAAHNRRRVLIDISAEDDSETGVSALFYSLDPRCRAAA
jgi:hypothetical protein